MTQNNQITILGGGPSGLTAALNLSKLGYEVIVLEQKSRPGERFRNGWQILENYSSKIDALEDLRSMNLNTDFYRLSRNEISFFDSKLNKFAFKSKKPFGYFIKRGPGEDTLDSVLHRQAVSSGVKIRYNTVGTVEEADIISTGSKYATGISKEISFDSDSDDVFITVIDNYLTPRGFSYLFIINGRGTIGTAILKDFKYINQYADSVILRMKQINKFSMHNIEESVSSVGFFLPKTAVKDNKLFIGEAAGFQDYLFGIGIRRSLQSGYLAAGSISEGIDFDELWKQKFGKQLKSSIINRLLYEKAGNSGLSLAMKLAHNFDFGSIGYRLQNPSVFRLFLSFLIRSFWTPDTTCNHGSVCSWCRTI